MQILFFTIIVTILTSFSFPNSSLAAPECYHLGKFSREPEFIKIYSNPFFSISYNGVSSELGFSKLNKCAFAAGVLVFYRVEKATVTDENIFLPVHIMNELVKYPASHNYRKFLHSVDQMISLKERMIGVADFFGGVVNAIPQMKKLLR